MMRICEAATASGLVLTFDAEVFDLALSHGIGLDGALAGAVVATFIGLEVVRRLFGRDDGDHGGPFLQVITPKPLAG
jgi:hypothetical protein